MNSPLVKGLDFSEEKIRYALKHNRMLMLIIFTDKKCNLKCPYCFTSGWEEKRENLLSLSEYKDIIIQAKELGAKSVWWVGTGEPFLYEHWRELIDFITAQNMWVGIYTNGTLIDKEVVRFVNERNVSLYVKMNSFDPQIQDKLAGGIKGTYKKIQKGIKNLLEVGFNRENRFAIETVITKLNYHKIPEIFRWARQNKIIPFIEMMEYANNWAKNFDVSLEEHRDLFYRLLQIDQDEFGYSWIPYPPWVAMRCKNLYFSIAVDAEGNVQPCSGLHIKIGNVREKPLEFWWNIPELKELRDPEKIEPHYCKGCSLGNYGCKSHAYHVTGDLFALDPRISVFQGEQYGRQS